MKYLIFIFPFFIGHVARGGTVSVVMQTVMSGQLDNEPTVSKPQLAIFTTGSPAVFQMTYDTDATPVRVDSGIAEYALTGVFKLEFKNLTWTASACTIRVGDYLEAATPTDTLSVTFTATPPVGFPESQHEIILTFDGKPAPSSITNGNALPNTTNVFNMNSIYGGSISLKPLNPPNIMNPWSVFFSKPSSIVITPVP